MIYVNRFNYGDKKRIEPQNAVIWKDDVTETEYFMYLEDYSSKIKSILNYVEKSCKNADDILKYLNEEERVKMPFEFDNKVMPSLRDYAQLFVLISYLIDEGKTEKEELRFESYKVFLKRDRSKFEKVWKVISKLYKNGREIFKESNIEVYLLKGGAHKIKKYYLENNDLKSIRGASTLMNYVSEKRIHDIIKQSYIVECIIYIGGSKIFSILPSWADKDLYLKIEDEFFKYTISLQNAFCMSDAIDLNDLLYNYGQHIDNLDIKLDERKKLKIYNGIKTHSKLEKVCDKELWDGTFDKNEVVRVEDEGFCELCRVRYSVYKVYGSKINKKVCASCVHKHLAGKEAKFSFIKDCFGTTDNTAVFLEDISRKSIAVIYADGNNLGGVLKKMDTLPKQMSFSRIVEKATKDAVYEVLRDIYKNRKLEIVAIGGDDIFIITPAKDSIRASVNIMRKFEKAFINHSNDNTEITLSVGVAIAKFKTPIKTVLEKANESLSKAKKKAKVTQKSVIDIVYMDRNLSGLKGRCEELNSSLLPYTSKTAENIISLIEKLKKGKNVKTYLNGLLSAFLNVHSKQEAKLFYLYSLARRNEHYKSKNTPEYILTSNKVDGYEYECGFYRKGDENEEKVYFLWQDILNMWDFIGGEQVENN